MSKPKVDVLSIEQGATPDPANINKHTQRGRGLHENSMRKRGAGRSIFSAGKGVEVPVVMGGNQTLEIAATLGMEVINVHTTGNQIVNVVRDDIIPGSPEFYAMGIEDNEIGKQSYNPDIDILAAVMADPAMQALRAEDKMLADIVEGMGLPKEDGGEPQEPRKTLSERFGVPPFSVLNARGGVWQDRKRAWLALGIQGEIGRDMDVLAESDGYKQIDYYEQKRKTEYILGQRISTSEFQENYLIKSDNKLASGISIFDPVLCELAYRWFMPQDGGKVLDPFAGGSVRGITASILGKEYTGVDLSARQIEANEQQGRDLCKDKQPRWINGDSVNIKELAGGEYDFVFSCPPYADLEVYSDDPADLSRMEYADFIKAYREIIAQSVSMLKDDRFACFVVGDVRDKKGFYRNFPAHTIDAFQDAGMILYNEAILVTAVGSLPIRVGRQFDVGRKLGKTHQNVLVFYKGNPKAIKDFGAVEFGEVEGIDETP